MGELLVLVGALLALLSAVGVVRFDSALPRMHALTKAATGGIVAALVGTMISLHTAATLTTLLLTLALQLFTFPVGANLIAHGVYKHGTSEGGHTRPAGGAEDGPQGGAGGADPGGPAGGDPTGG